MDKGYLYNMKWTTPKGFAASLSIQSDDLDELLDRAKTAMEKLVTVNGHTDSNGATKANPPEHYCSEHQSPFKQYSKDDRTWHAHKNGSKWCREKQT